MIEDLDVNALVTCLAAAEQLEADGDCNERQAAILSLDAVLDALSIIGAGRPRALYRLRDALDHLDRTGQAAHMLRAVQGPGQAPDSSFVEAIKSTTAAAVTVIMSRGINRAQALTWAVDVFSFVPQATRNAIKSRAPVGIVSSRTVSGWVERYAGHGAAPARGRDCYRRLIEKYGNSPAPDLHEELAKAIWLMAGKIPSNPNS